MVVPTTWCGVLSAWMNVVGLAGLTETGPWLLPRRGGTTEKVPALPSSAAQFERVAYFHAPRAGGMKRATYSPSPS